MSSLQADCGRAGDLIELHNSEHPDEPRVEIPNWILNTEGTVA